MSPPPVPLSFSFLTSSFLSLFLSSTLFNFLLLAPRIAASRSSLPPEGAGAVGAGGAGEAPGGGGGGAAAGGGGGGGAALGAGGGGGAAVGGGGGGGAALGGGGGGGAKEGAGGPRLGKVEPGPSGISDRPVKWGEF